MHQRYENSSQPRWNVKRLQISSDERFSILKQDKCVHTPAIITASGNADRKKSQGFEGFLSVLQNNADRYFVSHLKSGVFGLY